MFGGLAQLGHLVAVVARILAVERTVAAGLDRYA